MSKRVHEDTVKTDQLLDWLREREDEMAALLAELVAIPTENPPGKNYRACADLLENRLRKFGLECERLEASELKGSAGESPVSLIASCGRGERVLYFHGHYDVVPAQSRAQFQPLRRDHFLFGRGSCDMKGGIVAMLYAILALKDCGAGLDGRIALTLVPNEETGGEGGSAWLARQGRLGRGGIGMLLAEPTSGAVWNANRGAISMRVRVLGKSAHVGLQHQGENAFERMVEVVRRIQRLKQEVEQRTTKFNDGAGQAGRSILMLGGQSGGGTNFNVVPEECWFTIDRRINPEEDLREEQRKLIATLESCKSDGIRLEWEILQEAQSSSCREDEPLGQALARSVRAVTGEAPQFEMCPGLLEIRYYAGQGIPAYAYGPGQLEVAHGPDEFVDLRRIIDCAAVYALMALDILHR
jgi:succinyl-diaminopimelate desuccinylase